VPVVNDDTKEPSVLEIPNDMRIPSLELARLTANSSKSACTKALVALGVVFALGLVNALKEGLVADYLVLMILSLISLAAVWMYNFVGVMIAAGTPRRRWLVVPTLAIMLPYLLGFYVAIWRGLWGLFKTTREFSWQAFVPAFFCLLLGFFLLTQLRRLVEVRQAVDEAVNGS